MTRRSKDEENLVEEAASAYRPERLGAVSSHPAWHDLSPEGRQRAFDRALLNRKLEAALDEEGLNSTVRAVLARIRQARPENEK